MSAPEKDGNTTVPADDGPSTDSDATVTGMAVGRAKKRTAKATDPAKKTTRRPTRRSSTIEKAKAGGRVSSTDRVKMLAELGWEKYSVGRSLEDQIFVTPRIGPPVSRLLENYSRRLSAELALELEEETGQVFTASERRDAVLTLSDKALKSEPIPTAVRIANPDADSIAVDLCNDHGEYVLITKDGWEITDKPGRVAFVRGPRSKALPAPVPGGDISRLWELMNIAEPMRPMIIANLLTSLIKSADHPILTLTGQAGSAKTSTMGMYTYLLDPVDVGEGQGHKDAVVALPDDIRDIYVTAGTRYFLPFDNIDSMTRQQQTALSIIATGGMREARTLYTDGATTQIPVRGCLALTAIDMGKLKPDFLDRIIGVDVQPIPGGVFLTPGEVMAKFNSIHGQVLGGLFDLAVYMLANVGKVRRRMQRDRVRVARMADFSYILATIDEALGTDAFGVFMSTRDERQAEAANDDTLSATLMALIDAQDKGMGVAYTPTELLAALNAQFKASAGDQYARPPKGWPDTPNYMSRLIKLQSIPLRNAGYIAELVKSNGTRKWRLEKIRTAAETAPDPTMPAPSSEPERPALRAVPATGLSKQCARGGHDECAKDRRMNWISARECRCGCHDSGGDGGQDTPLDFGPDPDAGARTEPTEQPGNTGIDAGFTEPAAQAEPGLFSARTVLPWKVKMSAYVDLGTGEGLTDDGRSFTVKRRGKVASLAELLAAVPEDVKYVQLVGVMPGTGNAASVRTWAHGRLPKGWTAADRQHSFDDEREQVSLRYRRPDRSQLTVYRAKVWLGDDEEAETSPADMAAAFALTLRGIGAVFGDVCGEQFGVPLKSTPAATGLELIRRTLPRDPGTREPYRFPILDDEMQRLIRTHGGQARNEEYSCTTHPSGGAEVPDTLPGLFVYDMRFAYAAILDREMPCGPVVHDQVATFATRGKSWIPCLYRVEVTVPEGWDSPGRFRTRDGDVWVYPSTPGTTFEAWAWDEAIYKANLDGWRLGEHVRILDRYMFTGPKVKPLSTFGRHMRTLRDSWISAQTDASETVRELARIMARQITIGAIGKLAGVPYLKLRTCGIDDEQARPDDAVISDDGQRWEWTEEAAGRDYLLHPEWSSYIWSVCREWLYSHPVQKGVGLRHVPRGELIAARTDAVWTSTPLPVVDTGKVGHFRAQLEHTGPISTPRTSTELLDTRRRLAAAAAEKQAAS